MLLKILSLQLVLRSQYIEVDSLCLDNYNGLAQLYIQSRRLIIMMATNEHCS